MHRYGKNVIVSVFDMYQIRIRVGYRYDHTEEYQAKQKKIIVFIPIQLGYAWDTSKIRRVSIGYERSKKKGGEFDTWMISDHRSAQLG